MPIKKVAPTCAARPLNPAEVRASRSRLSSRRPRYSLVVYRPLAKFYRDRGPHLAAMIAYFALLSFVPLTFLALSLLGLTGRADESSYHVTELKKVFPGTSVSAIVKAVQSVQRNAATLGIIGGIAFLWASLSFFSVLEAAFNIFYRRPKKPVLPGKAPAVPKLIALLGPPFVGVLA